MQRTENIYLLKMATALAICFCLKMFPCSGQMLKIRSYWLEGD